MMNIELKIKRIMTIICLLVTVGILCIQNSLEVSATGLLAEEPEGSTVLDAPAPNTPNDSNTPNTPNAPNEVNRDNEGNIFTLTLDGSNGDLNGALRILITLTLISLAPILIIMMTSFTRIIIVLHFTRAALNTQTAPPNQVLLGLALILTFFIMQPTVERINTEAIQPFEEGLIEQDEAWERGVQPLREFMYPQTQLRDVQLFLNVSGQEWNGVDMDTIPLSVLVPSFMISELRSAFWIGFTIYIPFIVIDMVVASTLMSMGMMMLPPTTVSMPFKILLFVLADGWSLVIGNLIQTFY